MNREQQRESLYRKAEMKLRRLDPLLDEIANRFSATILKELRGASLRRLNFKGEDSSVQRSISIEPYVPELDETSALTLEGYVFGAFAYTDNRQGRRLKTVFKRVLKKLPTDPAELQNLLESMLVAVVGVKEADL